MANHAYWLLEEDEILRQNFSTCSWNELVKLIPRHTQYAIKRHAYAMGLNRNDLVIEWQIFEDEILENHYETSESSLIMKLLPGRTWAAIKRRAGKLRLDRSKNILHLWTKSELEILRKVYPVASWEEIYQSLPNRSKANIYVKASKLEIERPNAKRPNAKKGKFISCKNCGKKIYQPVSRSGRPYCSKECGAEYMSGENAPNWQGGISFEPYPTTFNERFKRMIRQRDNYICFLCGEYGNDVHHINYVKDDTVPENCVILCQSCHGKTNYNRDYWRSLLLKAPDKR